MDRFVCVHGHFYQPPRENPWLETIELQDSAYPYHDWNERITAESYGPNAASRILDDEGYIVKIVNNYARISFNFGPTVLSWMEQKMPSIYKRILEADKESARRFSGHGSAMAQIYNHMIMPLAHPRDKRSQVLWGLQDFEYRYKRKPEGMWLPETAVDLESLELLASNGIRFTVLAPHQARQVRKIGTQAWTGVSGAKVDPKMPYQIMLPSGKTLAIFFYDGPISRAVAFEQLLNRGENLVGRLMGAFDDSRSQPQLVHIATDGETFGHHHRFGDMALAYALEFLETNQLAKLTNYGEFLEKFPPTHEVEIVENSSWSCVHGVERWQNDCGCNIGTGGWTQTWRAPLRQALDWLRDEVAPRFEDLARQYLKDPWDARNAYIRLLLNRNDETLETFLHEQASHDLTDDEKVIALKLLELQRQAMLMYTSCGWFFDEISGIEAVQVLQYAARALQLAEEVFNQKFEEYFLQLLEAAPSNIPEFRNGRVVFEKFAKESSMDLQKVGAHFAISSMFDGKNHKANTYCYRLDFEEGQNLAAGRAKLALGKMQVTSNVTRESAVLLYAILHLGDHNVNGGVETYPGDEAHEAFAEEIMPLFKKADFPEALRTIDRHFKGSTYSLKILFRDEQRRILDSILGATLSELEADYRKIFETNVPLMRFLSEASVPLPRALQAAAEFIINVDLKRGIENDGWDVEEMSRLIQEAKEAKISLDKEGLAFTLRRNLWGMMGQFRATPEDTELLARLVSMCDFAATLPFEFDFSRAQNIYYEMLVTVYPAFKLRAEAGEPEGKNWVTDFLELGQKLRVRAT